jgi:hypothetical protein
MSNAVCHVAPHWIIFQLTANLQTTTDQPRHAHPVERSNAIIPHQPRQEPLQNSLQADKVSHGNAMAYNIPFQPPPRGSSQTPTEARPQSSRSNIGTPIRRPVSRSQLEPKGVPEHTVLGPKHTTRVHKSNDVQRCETPKANTAPTVVPEQVESVSLPEPSTPVAVSGKVSLTLSQYWKIMTNEIYRSSKPLLAASECLLVRCMNTKTCFGTINPEWNL